MKAERAVWLLSGIALATALASLWLLSVDGYARTFIDTAVIQFLC